MSFAAEIQGSIRAQLADCLVGISCQRLDFLAAHRLRVPRCELLLPTSGVRGTIRSGNFSQLANVLQAGGEEGMWTYDRYQRWMEQATDWVRPAPAAPVRDMGESEEAVRASSPRLSNTGLASTGICSTAAISKPNPATGAPLSRSSPKVKSAPGASPADDIIEIPAEEMDLAQLAELAKKVIEPPNK